MADSSPPAPPAESATSPPPAAARPALDLPFLVAAGVAILAALVLVRNLLPAKRDLAETLRREEALRKEIEALRDERDLLELREKALREDPVYMERVLRGQTGMSKPGEILVR